MRDPSIQNEFNNLNPEIAIIISYGLILPKEILDIPKFYNTLGTSKDTPGVVLMWNGNILKFFDGINSNQYDAEKLKAEIAKMK